MSNIEKIVSISKQIETTLVDCFEADGRGLHEKLSSVEDFIPAALARKIRRIATLRNKTVHEDGFNIENMAEVEALAENIKADLKALLPKGKSSATTIDDTLRSEPASIKLEHNTKSVFSYKTFLYDAPDNKLSHSNVKSMKWLIGDKSLFYLVSVISLILLSPIILIVLYMFLSPVVTAITSSPIFFGTLITATCLYKNSFKKDQAVG